jgi:putative ABC transport system ATP-binding protein
MDIMSTYDQPVHIIELRGVTKIFPTAAGGFTALHEVDLRLQGGEFIAVVGRSGSGKSTLLNLVAGIDRPTAGEIFVGGTPVHELTENGLAVWRGRNVGVVFQFFQLLPTLTILENVALPMDFVGRPSTSKHEARALELLEMVGIPDQASKLPSALSGGQQQRAAIARALANDPQLLVADEPTGNLDSRTADAVLELLSAQVRAGRSVLMVTHERELSGRVDRVITLGDGRVTSSEGGRKS